MKRVLCGAVLSLACGSVVAGEMPQRKAGLWEIQMEMAQRGAAMPVMKQCIDEKTDAEIQKRALQGGNSGKVKCPKQSFNKVSGGWEIESVCKIGETVATTQATMKGDFQSAYVMEASTHYAPPLGGMSDGRFTMRAKWMGACPAGSRPGDTTVNGQTFNVLDMQHAQATGGAKGAGKLTPEQLKQLMEMAKKQQAAQ